MPGHAPNVDQSIAPNMILTLVTCGPFNVYWQYRQMRSVNALLDQGRYSFWPWRLFALIRRGLYPTTTSVA